VEGTGLALPSRQPGEMQRTLGWPVHREKELLYFSLRCTGSGAEQIMGGREEGKWTAKILISKMTVPPSTSSNSNLRFGYEAYSCNEPEHALASGGGASTASDTLIC